MNIFLLFTLLLTSCTGIPKGIEAIDDFQVNRYLGTWYEIARLDHRFERGLENITATYTLRDDGGLNVVNRGLNPRTGEWKMAEGKAYFVKRPSQGRLKVSFFGPFYGGYNIIALDKKDYSYAMITGPDKSYLWILSRTPRMPKTSLEALLDQAKNQGFAIDQLIRVNQAEN